jgi:hypothetical protein
MKSVLLDYARKCTGKDYFDGVVYDRNLNMSVYNDGEKRVPLIEADKMNMGVMTKTEAARERDDTLSMVLASQTKTFSQLERDDQGTFNN